MLSVEAFRAQARAWFAAHLPAAHGEVRARGADDTPERIADQRVLQRAMYDAGLAGVTVPVAFDGQGLTADHDAAFWEEAQDFELPDFGVVGDITFSAIVPTVLSECGDDFKRHHIPRMLAGDELWCLLLSEPDAGSDLAAVSTRARRDGDEWVLDGAKVWTSGAMFADFGLCIARTDWDAPKHQGLTWFAVPMNAAGVSVRPIREINGGAEFCETVLSGVRLDDSHVLGAVNEGWKLTTTFLTFERGGARHISITVPGELPRDLVALAAGRDLLGDSYVRQQIATVFVHDAARALFELRVRDQIRRGVVSGVNAAYTKLAKGIYDPQRARIAMSIAGQQATVWDDAGDPGAVAALNYLNGRVQAIAGGSNEMQRNAIGEQILGLPRERADDRGVPFRAIAARRRTRGG